MSKAVFILSASLIAAAIAAGRDVALTVDLSTTDLDADAIENLLIQGRVNVVVNPQLTDMTAAAVHPVTSFNVVTGDFTVVEPAPAADQKPEGCDNGEQGAGAEAPAAEEKAPEQAAPAADPAPAPAAAENVAQAPADGAAAAAPQA